MALLGAGYYVWSIPAQEAGRDAGGTAAGVALPDARRSARGSDLMRREQRGTFAFLGDFFAWLGVMRRLQTYIVQANLKYRAADVVGISLALVIIILFPVCLMGMSLILLRLLLALLIGAIPIAYIR